MPASVAAIRATGCEHALQARRLTGAPCHRDDTQARTQRDTSSRSVDTATAVHFASSSSTKRCFSAILATVSVPSGRRTGGSALSARTSRAFASFFGLPGCWWFAHLEEAHVANRTGVVHQIVDAPVPRADVGECRIDGGRVGEIDGRADDLQAVEGQGADCFVERRAIVIEQCDREPFAGEGHRDTQSDAAGSSGDHGDMAGGVMVAAGQIADKRYLQRERLSFYQS